MTGRGMRHRGDRCESYILDAEFATLWQKRREMFGGWCRDALVRTCAASGSTYLGGPAISPGSILMCASPHTTDTEAERSYSIAAVVAGVAAYLSARFLLRYFESGRLDPYGWYCIAAGVAAFAYFTVR
jgi:undecaprenyl pyrophosphate phosphatase UppP